MRPTYDANAEIELTEVEIEFPKEGLSSQARVLLSLYPVPGIRFEFLHDSQEIQRLLFDVFFEDEPTAIRLSTGVHACKARAFETERV